MQNEDMFCARLVLPGLRDGEDMVEYVEDVVLEELFEDDFYTILAGGSSQYWYRWTLVKGEVVMRLIWMPNFGAFELHVMPVDQGQELLDWLVENTPLRVEGSGS